MSGADNGPGFRADAEELIGRFGASLWEYAVYTLDPEGTVSTWNPGAERITGAAAAEVVGRNISVFYTAEQLAAGYPGQLLERAARLGSYTDEGWRVRRDGTRFWAHVTTIALWSSRGTLQGFARVTRDDTESHSRLERSLRQFRDLFGLTPVGIGVFDRHGHVFDSNPALRELFGYGEDEMRGVHIADMLHPDEPDRQSLLREFRGGEPPEDDHPREWSMIRADGRRVLCELHVAKSVRDTGESFWLAVFLDVTERHRRAEEWHYWATHDSLTDLPNRTAVHELLSGADMRGLAMLYCDITNFRRINESLGLRAGDELLIEMAKRMRSDLPREWLAARMAADEYLIVCPEPEEAGGVDAIAETVGELFHRPVYLRGHPPIQVSASIGIAVGDDATGADDLLRSAGAAVMEAKSNERRRIAVAGPTLISAMDRQMELESELRTAIGSDQLTLHYQPIVRATGVIVAAEALVRWNHPERGLLGPDTFLPVAERADLLGELDRCVLRTAMRDTSEWPVKPDGNQAAVSINLAELSPGDPGFVATLDVASAETGLRQNRVVVELLETSLINLSERGRDTMSELTGRGLRFAVDDFGTGYSSLARLRELPIDVIKIDRGFVRDVVTTRADLMVVKAIVDLAKAIGCTCTAEGVETVEQFELLRGVGVHTYQGWLFAPAVSAAKLRELLASGTLSAGNP
ncbi:phosphodiesterase [Actinopolyspora erythraea]|uniref:Phosphodiesterase n=1 Tax=Actinopolyspora erythraea TaxID=414996 RepID=A0A099D256_9ACTN|nr:EAL domain-containing protein [Actinopolyspora erythraea]ASU77782.1 phosphodiesterase [Actinopolyspora erythraea]KGI79996.1 diguanylate phosphodiesterase [Actinopolyspora erythraea]